MKQEYSDIITSSLEDVMHDCFMPYAEHVILERALPRVEDGLKPSKEGFFTRCMR